jgi:hypothetical protein
MANSSLGSVGVPIHDSASAEVIFKGVLDPARLRGRIDNMVDQLKDGASE